MVQAFLGVMAWVFLGLLTIAMAGFVRVGGAGGWAFGLPTASYAALAMVSAAGANAVVTVRSIQYVVPLLFLGVLCLAFVRAAWAPHRISGIVHTGMRIVALLIFLLLVGSNISTQYRAIRFVNAHTLQTDPIVHRLDPTAPEW